MTHFTTLWTCFIVLILVTVASISAVFAQQTTNTTNGQAVNTGYLLNCIQTMLTPNSTEINNNSTKILVHGDSNNAFVANTAYTCTVMMK
jgi:hypothetical protein